MTVSAAVPKTAPVMIAWEAFKATEQYANAARWAVKEEHTEGSLWHAFYTGFYACAVNNATQAPQDVAGLVEGDALAQFLHDEIELPDKFVGRHWPLHDDDDGYRGDGGYVKLQPKDVVERYRDAAKQLIARYPALRASPTSQEDSPLVLAAADNNHKALVERDPAKLDAKLLTDAELIAEQTRVEQLWDSMFEPDEDGEVFEGHGGSPGEWMQERMIEIADEQQRRAAFQSGQEGKAS